MWPRDAQALRVPFDGPDMVGIRLYKNGVAAQPNATQILEVFTA